MHRSILLNFWLPLELISSCWIWRNKLHCFMQSKDQIFKLFDTWSKRLKLISIKDNIKKGQSYIWLPSKEIYRLLIISIKMEPIHSSVPNWIEPLYLKLAILAILKLLSIYWVSMLICSSKTTRVELHFIMLLGELKEGEMGREEAILC